MFNLEKKYLKILQQDNDLKFHSAIQALEKKHSKNKISHIESIYLAHLYIKTHQIFKAKNILGYLTQKNTDQTYVNFLEGLIEFNEGYTLEGYKKLVESPLYLSDFDLENFKKISLESLNYPTFKVNFNYKVNNFWQEFKNIAFAIENNISALEITQAFQKHFSFIEEVFVYKNEDVFEIYLSSYYSATFTLILLEVIEKMPSVYNNRFKFFVGLPSYKKLNIAQELDSKQFSINKNKISYNFFYDSNVDLQTSKKILTNYFSEAFCYAFINKITLNKDANAQFYPLETIYKFLEKDIDKDLFDSYQNYRKTNLIYSSLKADLLTKKNTDDIFYSVSEFNSLTIDTISKYFKQDYSIIQTMQNNGIFYGHFFVDTTLKNTTELINEIDQILQKVNENKSIIISGYSVGLTINFEIIDFDYRNEKYEFLKNELLKSSKIKSLVFKVPYKNSIQNILFKKI
ncbi:hypothetical protein V2E24_01020 [Mycoplasmopsis ciconiae]|uniref:Uncharacterized protein n=1 Tax=Mycoplasmopsis ciconiae TaxID=561067 RepID=A0ABU7MKW6_9BACT|nr:hypothetical protein [Mycoplasmopsis ciconiae]